ncbi:MAG: glycoside hydrolase family 9 protein [Deltaproteobacteria bacterium]|nr:glycoside hydrolase family 9 protein [Deltaproteobacteria bacterium]
MNHLRTYNLLILLIFVLFIHFGCGSVGEGDGPCLNGLQRCNGNSILTCEESTWAVTTDCRTKGKGCIENDGLATCGGDVIEENDSETNSKDSSSGDGDTDSDGDSDSDGDGDSDGDTDTDGDGDTDGDTDSNTEEVVVNDFDTDSGPAKTECGALDTTANGDVSQYVFTNHIGYELNGGKIAVVEASGQLSTFQVVDSGNNVVACGSLTQYSGFSVWGGGPNYYTADFGYLQTTGTYRVLVNGTYSPEFEVGAHLLLKKTAKDVLSYFNNSRADHETIWAADEAVTKVGAEGTYDVRGGWYDASGDVSKYLSHLSYANFMNPQQIPLVIFALMYAHDAAAGPMDSLGIRNALLEEALFGADYLVRVLDDEGYFYINVFDGWSGATDAREICAFKGEGGEKSGDFQAAFREGGGMAVATLARISTYGSNGAFSSSDYLEAAQIGFAHLEANNISYCDDGKENIIDDYTALLAAIELFGATNDDGYLASARARADKLMDRLHSKGYFIADDGSRPFWHASDAGLPVVALARYAELETSKDRKKDAADAVRTHLEYLVNVTREVPNPYGYARQTFVSEGNTQDGFFIPHDNETEYWWQGENARLGSLSAAALIGGRMARGAKGDWLGVARSLSIYAANQVDWILGKNPFDVCFMHGHGRNNPPAYGPEKGDYGQVAHNGGISNGVTGAEVNGSGIEFLSDIPREDWGNATDWGKWRWVEQWLPHASWYLIAISAMAAE